MAVTEKAELINEQEAARMLSLATSTLRAWRFQGRGPAYFRIGGKAIRYRVQDVEAYLNDSMVRPTDRQSSLGARRCQ